MSEDFDRTLTLVCEMAVKFGGVEHSGIVVFDAEFKTGKVHAEFPAEIGAIGKLIPLEGVAEQDLVKSARPILIEDVEASDELEQVKPILLELGIKSLLIIPVLVDGQIKGSISFDSLSENREFTADEIDQCRSLANVVSLIFKNASLLEETRIQTENLEALRRATLAITREHDRQPLLRTIIEQAVQLLKVQNGGLYELNRRRGVLEVIADYNRPKRIGLTLNLGDGMAGRLLLSADKYMTTSDYGTWKGRAESLGADAPFGSVLEVPLLWQKNRTGVLYVDDVRGRDFTREEATLLQRFAATASIALEHSRVTESDRYRLGRLQFLSSATNDIVSRINTADLDEQLTVIALYAHEILNAEACGILRVKKPGYLTLVASDGHRPGGFPKGKEFEITSGNGTGLTGHIASEGKTFNKCGEELANHFAVANKEADTSPTGICHSLLAVPLKKIVGGVESVTGLLRISNKRDHTDQTHPWVCFSEADEFVAEIFAQAATVVLETTELVDQIKRGKERYENLLNACNIIVKAKTLDQGLHDLADLLVTLIDKSFCRIFLIDENQKSLYIMAAVQNRSPEKRFTWTSLVGEMAQISEWHNLDRALHLGKASVLSFDCDADRENLGRLSKKLEIKSQAGEMLTIHSMFSMPLKVGHRTVGLINVGDLGDGVKQGFSENEQELALAIASQATLMIDKARHEGELTRLRKLDSMLLQAISQIRATQGVEELFQVIVKNAANVISTVSGMVIQMPASRQLRVIDSNGRSFKLVTSQIEDLAGTLGLTAKGEGSRIAYDFRAAQGEEGFLLEYNFNLILATKVSFSPNAQCVLFVGDQAPWSEIGRADLEILERLGQQAGISLSKALAQEQVIKARDGAYLVAEAMALDKMDVVLEKAVEGILKSMDCDTVTLYILDRRRKGEFVFPPELAGVDDKEGARLLLWKEKAAVTNRIRAIDRYHPAEDTLRDPLLDGAFVRREGIVSSAGIPIVSQIASQNEKIGVMFVNYRRRHRFDENDEKNLEFLAHEVAVAIRNLHLYNDMKRQEVSLAALYETERAIAYSTDLQSTLEKIAEQVWNVAHANHRKVNVVSINRIENNHARVVAAYPRDELTQIQRALNGEIDLIHGDRIGLVGVAYQEKHSRFFTNLKNEPQHIRLHAETHSELVALIENVNSEIVGAITVENSEENAFDNDDLAVVQTLANQAGVAIDKDRHAQDLKELNRKKASLQAISMMGMAFSIWGHDIHRIANKIRESADSCLQHHHRRLKRGTVRKELEEIQGNAERLTNKPITAPLFAEEGMLDELINNMINRHLNKLEPHEDCRGVRFRRQLKLTDETTVRINRDWFNKALALFTRNSLRAMKTAQTKYLTLTTSIVEDSKCLVEITDTGLGMDPDVWAKLFEEPIANQNNRERMGVGLLAARMIIEAYGGAVCKIVNSKEGVKLGFWLPISNGLGASDDSH